MEWSKLEEMHKNTFGREYVACHEPHERNWIIDNVIQVLPQYRKSVVEQAVVEVCTSMKVTPRLRKEFFTQLSVALDAKRLHIRERHEKMRSHT
ncbi:MAG: hypothetical protein HYZ44_06135 [Bacteroidetes bacterium]|nr:hypothetical protein [Bacteroidota bacterium]